MEKNKAIDRVTSLYQHLVPASIEQYLTLFSQGYDFFSLEIKEQSFRIALTDKLLGLLKDESKIPTGLNKNDIAFLLACLCPFKEGLSVLEKEAFETFSSLADIGYIDASYWLSLCYIKGLGTPVDQKKALDYLQSAAKQGYAIAEFSLGCFYEKGGIIKQDYQTAFKWFSLASQKCLMEAECELGECYSSGLGTEKDLKKSYEYYKKASDSGYAPA
ncbi:MAG: tetratricopeptide repeat protein, partial [Bacilli bacterium]